MMNVIDLNRHWTVAGYGPQGETVGPFEATVPGHVHTDLLRHGCIDDPMWRDQARYTQWIEEFDWVYETSFHLLQDRDFGGAVIRFEGLDTVADLSLNDRPLGTVRNMFVGHDFPVQHLLKRGLNTLRIRFVSIKSYMQDKAAGKYVSLFSDDRVFVRRMQCTFGWDWVNRLVSYGIWRPVRLLFEPFGAISNTRMATTALDEGSATLAWSVELERQVSGNRLRLQLEDATGSVVWRYDAEAEEGRSEGAFTLERPRLWWPSGYGEAGLYTFRTSLYTREGDLCCERAEEIGIRTIAIEQIPDAQGSSFTIVVNGKRIFAKGGNWVPVDPFPSAVGKEKYEHLLKLLTDGHMNMLRVWGGGTYELPEFWSACNRLGIMVSVDFMLACAQYPEHEAWFQEEMREEVTYNVKQLRNHPSLIFWSGDNELAMNNNAEDAYWGKHLCEHVTAPLCAELDPLRPFLPTSPYLGKPFNSQDEGDCHFSAWYDADFIVGDLTDYRERITQGRGRFLSECVVFGAPPLSSLLKMMTMDDVADPAAPIWEYRTKDNPYNGQDELTHYRMLEKTADKLFGLTDNVLQKVKHMEYVQYEFARLQAEHYRRRKYATSGLLFWMYADCWPANGCSLVDYYGLPKAGYYGAKKAFRPVMVSFEDLQRELAIWLSNDTLADGEGTLAIEVMTTSGHRLYEQRIRTKAPANAAVPALKLNKTDIGLLPGAADVVAAASWLQDGDEHPAVGEWTDRTVYFDVLPKRLQCPQAALRTRWQQLDGKRGILEISADVFARVVSIEEELLPEDNYFDLMPGETRRIACSALHGRFVNRQPKVTCWNPLHALEEERIWVASK